MQIDWWTLALQAVNFLVLVWLLQRFLYKPVRAVIARRQAQADSVLQSAEAARQKSEAERQALAAERATLAEQRQQLRQELQEASEAERQALLEKARGEAEEILASGRKRLAGERDSALEELKGQAATLAAEMAGRLLKDSLSGKVTDALLERAESALEKLDPADLAALRQELAQGGGLTVATATALDDGTQEAWRQRLRARLGDSVEITFRREESLLGGLVLHFPHSELDLSWSRALERARQDLAAKP